MITEKQLKAIRFYMGDPEIVKHGPYQGGPKAYNTINALLHDGTLDEREKIRDGKPIELSGAAHLKSYLDLIQDIMEAMVLYQEQHREDPGQALVSYRIDRISAVERLKQDRKIYGYFSTCKWGFLPEYARMKSDIVLLEVHRKKTVPYLDFSELFREFYAKPEEAEILLPYGAVISRIEEIPLSDEERVLYRDMNGMKPRGKWRIDVSAGKWEAISETQIKECWQFVTNDRVVNRISDAMRIMSEKRALSAEDELFYDEWKKKLLMYLSGYFAAHRVGIK